MRIGARPVFSGFTDGVADSQATFRAVLAAMSEPGRIVALDRLPAPPEGISPAAAAVLMALADFETALWLAAPDEQISAFLKFETGARIVTDPHEGAFAFIARTVPLPHFEMFSQGEAEYPDRSTTLVIDVEHLENEGGLSLSGPGIATTARLSAAPLPADFIARMVDNRSCFPLGIDLVLTAGSRLACLPRSVNVA